MFQAISLLVQGGCKGYVLGGRKCRVYVVGEITIKANTSQLKLELWLSFAIIKVKVDHNN